jgi:hypothetical protein
MPAKLWADFERLTATDLNTYVAQQVVAVFASAAARDLAIPAPVAGQVAFLTDTQALTVYSGSAWMELVRRQLTAQIRASAAQTITTGTLTKLTLPTVDYDVGGFALGSDRLTIPAGGAGLYLIHARVGWGGNASGFRRLGIYDDVSGNPIAILESAAGTANGGGVPVLSAVERLAAGLAVSAKVYQDVGASLGTRAPGGGSDSYLQLTRIGPTPGL